MLRKLARSIRDVKKPAILTPILIVGEVVMEIMMPLTIVRLVGYIRAAEGTGSMKYVIICGVQLLCMALISLLFGALAGKTAAKASTGFAKNLRHDLFVSVQNFSFSNIDKFSTSSLITRMTTDVNNVQMSFMMIIRTAVRAPLMMISAIIAAFSLHPTLPWLFVVVVPLLGLALGMIIKVAMPLFNRVFKKYDALNASIQENVKGMRVVKAYVREDHECEKFGTAAEEVKREFTRAEKVVALNMPVMNFFMHVNMLVIAFFGAKLIINGNPSVAGSINVETLSSLLTYSMQVLMSLMMCSMIFVQIAISVESARRIVEVLDEKAEIVSPQNPITEIADGSFAFENVSFKYQKGAEKYVLSDINLTVPSGSTVGIMGVTGSAKSSLVSLLPRLYDATEGAVYVGGKNVKEYDIVALRDAISVVLQKNLLFSGTIAENLRWGNPNATDEELVAACKIAQADEFIRTFPEGYASHIEQGGTNVSGGQKQRLCIARAILKKPKILIFDDSTSAVDTKTDAFIRKGLKEQIPNTTKIIIAQRVASVMDADVILIMEGGKIAAQGTHGELMQTFPPYREMYEAQNRVNEEGGEA
ncbi:MAG: ABC transporter ATP-binding protein [Clostridiales bacterium]|nr:ABC transporter ATP-binding protein [Clostridiales bacterium]